MVFLGWRPPPHLSGNGEPASRPSVMALSALARPKRAIVLRTLGDVAGIQRSVVFDGGAFVNAPVS